MSKTTVREIREWAAPALLAIITWFTVGELKEIKGAIESNSQLSRDNQKAILEMKYSRDSASVIQELKAEIAKLNQGLSELKNK